MAEHDQERRAQHLGAVLDRAHGGGIHEVAGIAGDEQLAEPQAAEQQLRRNAAVGAADDGRPRRLMAGDVGAPLGQLHHAHCGFDT
jgi:hypothetical protein